MDKLISINLFTFLKSHLYGSTTVVMAIYGLHWKWRSLTHCQRHPSEPIEKIFGTIDYVINLNNLAKFGFGNISRDWGTYTQHKVMPDEASVRQDSLRQDSLRQRVAYRAPGFERSCAQNGRKPYWGKSARAPDKILLKTTWSLEFNFHSLDGHIDLNPV